MFNKKAISPVVATSLLLVVAVVSVVGFQSWYQTFSSNLFVSAEQDSGSLDTSGIEGIIGDTLYLKAGNNLTVESIRIDGNDCNINGTYSGVEPINVSSCLDQSSTLTPDVVVVTSDRVISEKVMHRNFVESSSLSSSLDCSTLNGGEWILVPGNPTYGTSDFCVMKYEAKQNGSMPTSTTTNTPWVSINQTDAIEACSNLGTGYHLIRNIEWMTIARNLEQVNNNWVNSTGGVTSVGVGSLKVGNTGGFMAIEGASYDGLDPESSSDGVNSLGSLELDNGEIIWDLSGNVWEWNDDRLNMHSWDEGGISAYWNSQTNATFRLNAGPSNSSWNSSQGTGYVAHSSTQGNAFIRGGESGSGASASIFALNLNYQPSDVVGYIGFRCSYTP